VIIGELIAAAALIGLAWVIVAVIVGLVCALRAKTWTPMDAYWMPRQASQDWDTDAQT
jgi:hypothetical protein